MHDTVFIHAYTVLFIFLYTISVPPPHLCDWYYDFYESPAPYFLMIQKRYSVFYYRLWTCFVLGKTISTFSSFLITQQNISHCAVCGLFPTVSLYVMMFSSLLQTLTMVAEGPGRYTSPCSSLKYVARYQV